jgi:signal transduction histidine kinase
MLLSSRYSRKPPISYRFYLLIVITIAILVLEFAAFWSVLTIMSSIRAYEAGNGEWTKAQKESINSLLKYRISFDESDYDNFLTYLQVPQGDAQARHALESPNPNINTVTQDFLDGNNDINEIPGLILLFQSLHSTKGFQQILAQWTISDLNIQKELAIGDQIHSIILASNSGTSALTSRALEPLMARATAIDDDLAVNEVDLARTVEDVSRNIAALLGLWVLILSLALGFLLILIILIIARAMRAVDAEKNEFIALVSHQLRTPLTVIRLSMNILEKAELPGFQSEERRALGNISSEVPKMISLIDTILDVSRIDMGSLVITNQKVDIIAIAKAAVTEEVYPAQERGLHMRESYDPVSLLVPMDPLLLQMIFQNLLSNAVKYTPANGEVSIAISVAGSKINIRVSDTGYGIPKEQQRFIFNKLFFRADNVKGRVDKGTDGSGLGLYIVKSVVTKSGGTIRFESELGKGTTFFVTFPLTGMKSTAKA